MEGDLDGGDDWRVTLDGTFLLYTPGEVARQRERKLGTSEGPIRRFGERLLDVHGAERIWRRAADGEEAVRRRLARLPDGWKVIHDVAIGPRGANLDHLVIGPPGVFTLNTRNLTGRVTLHRGGLLHHGHRTGYLSAATREAQLVQRRLTAALQRPVQVWPLIVLRGCELDIRERPEDVTIVGRRHVPGWFLGLPTTRHSRRDVLELERAARSPATWRPVRPAGQAGPRTATDGDWPDAAATGDT